MARSARPVTGAIPDPEQLLRELVRAPFVVMANPYGLLKNPEDLSGYKTGFLYVDRGKLSSMPSGSVGASLADPTQDVDIDAQTGGVALTGMRSDAKLQLSVAIIPTWTGAHTFNVAPKFDIASATTGYLWTATDADGNGVWAAPTALDGDLTAIGAIADGSTGFLAKTAANSWSLRTWVDPTGVLSTTNPGGVAGNPTLVWAGTSGGIPYFKNAAELASSASLAASRLVVGGGAGITPKTITGLGTSTQVLHGNAGGDPSFSAIDLTTDVGTSILALARGGTGASLSLPAITGGILYTTGTATTILNGTATSGQLLTSVGSTGPAWTTATYPATMAIGTVLTASANNVISALAVGSVGNYLRAAGGGVAVAWSTLILPNTAQVGELPHCSFANTYTNLAAGTLGTVLMAQGAGVVPVWTAPTALPTGGTLVLRDANGNISADSFIAGYTTTATAAGTTTLTVDSTQEQYFTGVTTQNCKMPVTSTLVVGQSYRIINNSTGTVTVQASDGASTIVSLVAGTSAEVTCIGTALATAADWDAQRSWTGILPITLGGTGVATFTANGVLYGNGAGALLVTAQGAAGTVLHGNAGVPTFSAVSLTADVSGTLPIANGGTGAATLYANGMLFGNGTGPIQASTTILSVLGSLGVFANVGIGAINDGTNGKLYVVGSGYTAVTVASSDAGGAVATLSANSSSELRLGAVSSHPFVLVSGGAARLTVQADGNINVGLGFGIYGTARLHVAGSGASAAAFRIEAGAAPTTPNSGDFWNDSTKKSLMMYANNIAQSLDGTLCVQTADGTVANTAAETTLFGTISGSKTLPANFFTVGKMVRVEMRGIYTTKAAAVGALNIRLKLGSTVICATGDITSLPASLASRMWDITVKVTCRTIGATGTVTATASWRHLEGASGQGPLTEWEMRTASDAVVTIDTTASQVLDVTADWGTADALNSIISKTGVVRIEN